VKRQLLAPALATVLAAVLAAGGAAAAAEAMRLSGVIDGNATKIAMVAMADGSTRMLRIGDSLGEAKVVAIAKDGVRLQTPKGEQMLTLQGLASVESPREMARNLNNITRDELLRRLREAKQGPVDQPPQQRLASILGLPTTTSVVAVNGQRINGGDVIGAVESAVSSDRGGIKLGLAGLDGSQEIYFHPVSPPKDLVLPPGVPR
jgi:hypothetical protein